MELYKSRCVVEGVQICRASHPYPQQVLQQGLHGEWQWPWVYCIDFRIHGEGKASFSWKRLKSKASLLGSAGGCQNLGILCKSREKQVDKAWTEQRIPMMMMLKSIGYGGGGRTVQKILKSNKNLNITCVSLCVNFRLASISTSGSFGCWDPILDPWNPFSKSAIIDSLDSQ